MCGTLRSYLQVYLRGMPVRKPRDWNPEAPSGRAKGRAGRGGRAPPVATLAESRAWRAAGVGELEEGRPAEERRSRRSGADSPTRGRRWPVVASANPCKTLSGHDGHP